VRAVESRRRCASDLLSFRRARGRKKFRTSSCPRQHRVADATLLKLPIGRLRCLLPLWPVPHDCSKSDWDHGTSTNGIEPLFECLPTAGALPYLYFPLIPRRFIALRSVSSETSAFVSPRSWQTSATIGKLQVERAWPNCQGAWCSKARTCSHLASSSSGLAVLGRDDFCSRQPKPSVAKARITLRTVWSVQPSWRALWPGVFPSALRRRIWLLHKVNARVDRNPVRKLVCSLFVKDRTKRDSFMPPIFSRIPLSK
jgi:hypothetical protein